MQLRFGGARLILFAVIIVFVAISENAFAGFIVTRVFGQANLAAIITTPFGDRIDRRDTFDYDYSHDPPHERQKSGSAFVRAAIAASEGTSTGSGGGFAFGHPLAGRVFADAQGRATSQLGTTAFFGDASSGTVMYGTEPIHVRVYYALHSQSNDPESQTAFAEAMLNVHGTEFYASDGEFNVGSLMLDLAPGEVFAVTATAGVDDYGVQPLADRSSRARVTASWGIVHDITAYVPGLTVEAAVPFEPTIEPLNLGPGGTSNVIRYDYAADTGLFSEFILPDLILGTISDVQLTFDGFTETATTGTPIDFTEFVAGGIGEFSVTIDNSAGLFDPNGLSPFVVGVQMTDNGLAELHQTVNSDGVQTVEGFLLSPIYEELGRTGFLYVGNAVPEPSTLALLGTGGLAILVFACRRRSVG